MNSLSLYEKLQLLIQALIAVYCFTLGVLVYRRIRSIERALSL